MKQIILSIITALLFSPGFSQLQIENGVNWITSGNASIVLQDINLVNNGTIAAGSGSFKFTGTQNSGIIGNSQPVFGILEIAKTNNGKLILNRNINVSSSINFLSGQIDLNGSNILLSSGATITGETELNRITGASGGFIEITQNLNAPNGSNPGGLGAFITSATNLGSVTIRRGHMPQSGTGLPGGINRYYSIVPANNSNLNATLRLRYFDAEMNGQTESGLVIYQSNNGGTDWNNLSQTSRSSNSNYVEKTGLASLSLQTLANDVQTTAGVTGLVFTGQRKKPTEVKLNWTSQTETSMSGYQVQRKLDSEADFSDRGFVNTQAQGGNSISPLNYQFPDVNAHTGNSYYRLKIITTDNAFTYSDVITIAPKSKGAGGGGNGNGNGNGNNREMNDAAKPVISTVNETAAKITVGPNPNNGNFWFMVTGIEKQTTATLYTIDGKVLKQFRVLNQQQEKVNGLGNGMYILKVPGMDGFKIIVQGSSSATSNNTQHSTSTKY
jgi:hypothetical protein